MAKKRSSKREAQRQAHQDYYDQENARMRGDRVRFQSLYDEPGSYSSYTRNAAAGNSRGTARRNSQKKKKKRKYRLAHPEKLIFSIGVLVILILLLILLLQACGSGDEATEQEEKGPVQTVQSTGEEAETGTLRSVYASDFSSLPNQIAGYMVSMAATNPTNFQKDPTTYNEAYASEQIDPDDYLFIVAIDAGHGGSDSGWEMDGVAEKNINLIMAKKVQEYLNKSAPEYYAYLVRSADVSMGDQQRIDMINQGYADLVVSLHCNGSEEELGGTTAAYWTTEGDESERAVQSKELAEDLMEAAADGFGMWYREIREEEDETILQLDIPAVMVEMGYVTYSLDNELMSDEDLQDQAAIEIGNVLLEYMRKVAPAEENSSKTGDDSSGSSETSDSEASDESSTAEQN